MNIIKRKYVMSLVFDLVLLLVGSGLLYRLSLNLLEASTVQNLLFVIVNSVVLGAVFLDLIFEYVVYRGLMRMLILANTMSEEEQD
jgi:hypothetical protein